MITPTQGTLPMRQQMAPDDARTAMLRERVAQLEAAFLAEMLSHSGLGATTGAFGGGIGEEQFSSFLRQEQATLMVSRGGIGLAESLFNALSRGADAPR